MEEFLTIKFSESEMWDDVNSIFYTYPEIEVTFKYTLKVLDKWEMKYEKRF